MKNNLISENLKVLVLRSNIDALAKVDQVRETLLSNRDIYQVDVDLDDIDHVLRIECHPDYSSTQIKELVSQLGFECTPLL